MYLAAEPPTPRVDKSFWRRHSCYVPATCKTAAAPYPSLSRGGAAEYGSSNSPAGTPEEDRVGGGNPYYSYLRTASARQHSATYRRHAHLRHLQPSVATVIGFQVQVCASAHSLRSSSPWRQRIAESFGRKHGCSNLEHNRPKPSPPWGRPAGSGHLRGPSPTRHLSLSRFARKG